MIRTGFLALPLALALGVGAARAEADAPLVTVAKTATCACCTTWIEHLEKNGFAVEAENFWPGELVRFKLDNGVPDTAMSCHTAKVDGYVIEGHVPAADIRRLLEERPDAVGLAVPGMPLGSLGMDFGEDRDAYNVLLIGEGGGQEVFSSYPGN